MAANPGIDEVFRALADPSRRQLLDSLNGRNGQTLRELCAGLDMARQSVSKHLAVLEAANLVTTVRRGREKLHYLNAAPINAIGERWITRYERDRVEALADLKRALEDGGTVDKPTFVYTTYIKTTPERLWQALTEPAFTRRYWFGMSFDTVTCERSTVSGPSAFAATASKNPGSPGTPGVALEVSSAVGSIASAQPQPA